MLIQTRHVAGPFLWSEGRSPGQTRSIPSKPTEQMTGRFAVDTGGTVITPVWLVANRERVGPVLGSRIKA